MLNLKLSTDPRWVNLAEKKLEDILTDHAYCEQKAATSCISLIVVYPDLKPIVEKLTPIVSEEWSHFSMVLREIYKRGYVLGYPRKDEYVNLLLKFQNKNGNRNDLLVEKLLTNALIEARSCERFRILSLQLEDEYLRKFYHGFMVSEAGHYRLFMDLAKLYKEKKYVDNRWHQYLEYEKEIFNIIQLRGDRMH
ncbi:MAG: tRNA 2-methylthio-N6-isopentenyl adenosine(37) hydroxylase MiaE [Flavobacteriales bacterium]|nr:tRNA 2-methylthio-N6-isopentenyl adenosine(37) hydroxylase MiaE [Flavobacteriales bacterium]|tara:strand:+ start:20183 stop:20764 length:582 start_codon:yes stop_codon:yes gene_type:complete